MAKHRSVSVIEDSLRHFDNKIRAHADQVDVVGSVMDLAES
jgi:hypothetical protein